ncbi:phosphonate ABC transporter, permease protein PhnE [Solibacillus silvestris]|uniref:phosphonate ABC transporter, permease protein PhnE n=1 Tax=Solibacillus silvestris TaxID=76853 RepID=UPI003F8215A4
MNKIESMPIQLVESKSRKSLYAGLAIVAGMALSIFYLNISAGDILLGLPKFISFFFEKFLPATFDNVWSYFPTVLETLGYAVIATYFSTCIAFFIGLLMSENTNKFKAVRYAVRGAVTIIRNIPFVIWGALLVYVFGIGGLVGILALIFVTIGFLGKSYGEAIDEISGDKLEALRANGASYIQIICHGVIPQFIPAWINWTIFSFEINVRASVVLGLVGAGGIGVLIDTNINLFRYDQAMAIIIIVVLIVLCAEFITNQVRKMVS